MKKEIVSFAVVLLLSPTGYGMAQSHRGSMMGSGQNGWSQQMGPGTGGSGMGSGMMGSGAGGSMGGWQGNMGQGSRGGTYGPGTQMDQNSVAANQQLARTQAGGGVAVTATYANPGRGEDPKFEVALNTHSVNLDGYDLKTLSVLRDDAGKEYKPLRVDNEGGGHHRRATLVFPKPDPKARHVELVIKDIAGVKSRTFDWDLK